MDTITIICAVAAMFKNKDGEVFKVTPAQRGVIVQAPAWIQKTLLFEMLASDGSLKFVTPYNRVQVENEPLLGLNAEGKKIAEEKPAKTAQNGRKQASRKKNGQTPDQDAGGATDAKTEGKDEE